MKGICLMWSRGRHFSPSLPGDRYLKLGSKSDHRAEIWGNIVRYSALAFSLRMRSFLKLNFLLAICVGKSSRMSSQLHNIFLGEGSVSQKSLNLTNPLRAPRHSLWIVATPRREAIKLRNPPGFSYIENICKNKLLKTSELQFDNWFVVTFEKQTLGYSTYAELSLSELVRPCLRCLVLVCY